MVSILHKRKLKGQANFWFLYDFVCQYYISRHNLPEYSNKGIPNIDFVLLLCNHVGMWDYSDKVKEAFLRPKNVGEIENADAIGEVGSIVCGDALKLYLRIDRETETIQDARFQTFGCASAIASSSALTELIKGKTLDQALAVTNQDIADFLDGLPAQKMHCSVMGREALEAAIANYRGAPVLKTDAERVVCKCFDVTEDKIRRVAIENHLTTVEEITNFTKAGGGCGECRPEIEKILLEIINQGKQ